MAAVREELSAAKRGGFVRPRISSREAGVLLSPHRNVKGIPIRFGLYQFPHLDGEWMIALDVGHHQCHARTFSCVNQVETFLLSVRQWFLHQHVFALRDATHANGVMQVMGSGDEDGIHVQQRLAVIRCRQISAQHGFGRHSFVEVGIHCCGNTHLILEPVKALFVHTTHVAATNQCQLNHSSPSIPLRYRYLPILPCLCLSFWLTTTMPVRVVDRSHESLCSEKPA